MEPQYKTSYSDLLISVQHGNTILKKQFREARNKQELPAYVQNHIKPSSHIVQPAVHPKMDYSHSLNYITLHTNITYIKSEKRTQEESILQAYQGGNP